MSCTRPSAVRLRAAAPRAVAALAALAVLAPAAPSLASGSSTATATVDPATAAALPFDLPATSVLRGSARKAFAHYIPSFPQSFDNLAEASDYYTTQYLNPNGEGGKHAAYGGFVRDRPHGRAAMTDPAWKLRDMETDVRDAVAAGLDGFSVDLLELGDTNGRNWQNVSLLMQAAQNVDPGFKIMIMPDMTALPGKDAATLAQYVAQLGQSPAAYRLADGRLVVSPFYTEGHTVDWWKQFLSIMQTTYGTTVAFLPLFLNEQPYEDAFAPISYGMSNWGNRNPLGNDPTQTASTGPLGRIARVHALGQKWMAPVSTQDERPNQGLYDEAENTTNLRNTWEIALRGGADLVQLPTWNDYAEGAHIAPSKQHGWTFLDINAYYLTQWKTGAAPTTVRDTVYLTHRTQPAAATPSFPETRLMTLRGGSSPARDAVEALTFLTAPGTVSITVGGTTTSCAAPAGPGVCTAPLRSGSVSASVARGGATVTSVTSPYQVTTTPYVQDLQYVGVSSGRTGTRAVAPASPAPAPSPTPTPAPTPSAAPSPAPTTASAPAGTTVALAPAADSYAHEWVPTGNFGTSASLSVYGAPNIVSYLRFALPATPVGSRLASAQLQVHTNTSSYAGTTGSVDVRLADDSWSESTLTWTNRPATGALLGTLTSATTPDTAYGVQLDPAALAAGAGRPTTVALSTTSSDDLWLWSNDHPDSALRPSLVLTYAPDTTAPSAPGAPAATVSGSTVGLSWPAATDDVAVTGYTVHRSATAGFTPSAATQVGSTTGTSFSEPVAPGTWYYEVVAKDAAGNVGAPSAQASATVAAPPTAATVVSLSPTADSYAHEWAPTTNYGTSASLNAYGTPNVVPYLRFALPATPAGKTLTGAVLRFRTNSSSYAGSTGTFDIKVAGNTWSESTLLWGNRPAVTTTSVGRITGATAPNTAYSTPLTASVLAARAGQQTTLAVTTTSSDDLWLWSKDHPDSTFRPVLLLSYT